MGNFSWIIIAIVVIQAIAGGVAKIAEKRNAQMKKANGSPGPVRLSRSVAGANERKAKQASDLERMRLARIEALRNRQQSQQSAVSVQPAAAPALPVAVVTPVPKARSSEPTPRKESASRSQRAERARLREVARNKRAANTPRDYSNVVADHEKPKAPSSRTPGPSMPKGVVHHPTAYAPSSTSTGAVPHQPIGISSDAMRSMLSDPDSFKKAFILSELIAPPISLRPPADQGGS